MNDMTEVIQPKVDQLTADHLLGGPRTIRISGVTIRAGAEQPVTIAYDGDNGLPWRPCKSMSRVLVKAWGPDASAYAGRLVTLYRDDKVKWGGLEVGGVRVSHLSHIDREMVLALTEKKGSKKPFIVKPLVVNAPEYPWQAMNGQEITVSAQMWARQLAKVLAHMTDAQALRDWRAERGALLATVHERGDEGAALVEDAERAIEARIAELTEEAPA